MMLSVGTNTRTLGPCEYWIISKDSLQLLTCNYVLGEVGEVLDDFGDEGERSGRSVVRIFLHQVEERRRHDGGTEEAQEQRGADQTLADVLLVAASDALLLPRRKHFLQLPRKHTAHTERGCQLLLQEGRIRFLLLQRKH